MADIQPNGNFDILRIYKTLDTSNFKGCFMCEEIWNFSFVCDYDECFVMKTDDSIVPIGLL